MAKDDSQYNYGDTSYEERLKEARKRVKKIKEFYQHLVSYIIINIAVVLIDVVPDGELNWAYWVLFGWGIGVVFHAVDVYGDEGFWGKQWEERKIMQLMGQGKKDDRYDPPFDRSA